MTDIRWTQDVNDRFVVVPEIPGMPNETALDKGNYQVVPLGAGSEFRYRVDQTTGEVQFGVWHDDPTKRPGGGGMWSSRPGCLYADTGLAVAEVICGSWRMCRFFKLSALPVAPAGYALMQTDHHGEVNFEYVRVGERTNPNYYMHVVKPALVPALAN